jgi:hypothetical protein
MATHEKQKYCQNKKQSKMDEKQMLQHAIGEIKTLRASNQLMSARLEVYDQMMRLFHTQPNYGSHGMMHPDIVYEIDNYLSTKKDNQ